MREQLVSGDVAARKAYLASIVDAVIVSEEKIRTYNGLARQRALKAQYGVLTNFPSYEQVVYFSHHVVTLKDGKAGAVRLGGSLKQAVPDFWN